MAGDEVSEKQKEDLWEAMSHVTEDRVEQEEQAVHIQAQTWPNLS